MSLHFVAINSLLVSVSLTNCSNISHNRFISFLGLMSSRQAFKTIDKSGQKLNIPKQAIRESIEAGIVKRDEIWVTSKLAAVWMDPSKIAKAVQYQYDTLNIGPIDLYLIDCPWAHEFASPEEEQQFGVKFGIRIFKMIFVCLNNSK